MPHVVAVAQPSTKKVLFKLDKPINAFARTGYYSVYPSGINSMLTASVEFGETKDGFTIRNDFHMWKYDDNFKLLWQADLKKNLTLQALAHSSTIGDEKNCLFIEKAYSGDQFVQKIDEKGNVTNTKVEGTNRTFIMNHFLINHEVALLDGILDKKEDKLVYQLTRIGSSGKLLKAQGVDGPWDNFEYSEVKTSEAKDPLNSMTTLPFSTAYAFTGFLNNGCSWHVVGEIGDHILLKKAYFKDIEKSKKKELIIQTIEMDVNGKLYNHRNWKFDTQFFVDDTEFTTPKVEFDEVNKELLIFGYLAVDGHKINSLFLVKYDYQSQNLLYSKEYSFDKIFRESKSKKTHNNISASVRVEVPRAVTAYDYHLNKKDKILYIQILTNYHGSTTTCYEFKFDKNGDNVQTDLVEYGTYNFNYEHGVKSLPEFHETLMKDTSRPHFTSARPLANDYLNNNAGKSKDEIYAFTIDRLNYSIIVYYNEDSGEFSAIRIK